MTMMQGSKRTRLFVWFQPAHSSTDMLVDLGQNVSLNCDFLAVKEIYWFLQQYPSPPKPILRSFYRNSSPYFYNHSFKVKYSLQEKLQLAIQNITKNELGIFYCVETGDLMFRKGIRLYIMEPTNPPPHSTQQTHQWTRHETPLLVIMSAMSCCILLAVAIGLMQVCNHRKRHPGDSEYQYTVIIRTEALSSRRSSALTSVEFTQLSPPL
ncbi:hypothetical protein SRHO_G00310040 [Serrasalmus rhombeus]